MSTGSPTVSISQIGSRKYFSCRMERRRQQLENVSFWSGIHSETGTWIVSFAFATTGILSCLQKCCPWMQTNSVSIGQSTSPLFTNVQVYIWKLNYIPKCSHANTTIVTFDPGANTTWDDSDKSVIIIPCRVMVSPISIGVHWISCGGCVSKCPYVPVAVPLDG